MGAGAYICGEETALISSCEGKRGEPKNRPPFPAQKGYLEAPTSVNNVRDFLLRRTHPGQGPGWFAQMGSKGSPGTKLLSISGDCPSPGVYEYPSASNCSTSWKKSARRTPKRCRWAARPGQMVGPAEFDRTICYDDLATGGSLMVFGPNRDILKIAAQVHWISSSRRAAATARRAGSATG